MLLIFRHSLAEATAMYRYFVFLSVVFLNVAVAQNALRNERIVGGELTTIENYPYQSALLMTWNLSFFEQLCAGTILNARSILTAAHCFMYSTDPVRFRVRVGSSYANSGGIEHNVGEIRIHPSYNPSNADSDVAIVRTTTIIVHNNLVQPASIAGPGYNLPDNEPVLAIGWGRTFWQGPLSEQLRHVQVYTINQALCRIRYMEIDDEVTPNMLCSGVWDVGGRDQCSGDSGGPLLHNGVVVGICSWGEECAHVRYPGVNVRVSRFASWIQSNA